LGRRAKPSSVNGIDTARGPSVSVIRDGDVLVRENAWRQFTGQRRTPGSRSDRVPSVFTERSAAASRTLLAAAGAAVPPGCLPTGRYR
jgi:hypothetical protein